jgi:hypothetical protein
MHPPYLSGRRSIHVKYIILIILKTSFTCSTNSNHKLEHMCNVHCTEIPYRITMSSKCISLIGNNTKLKALFSSNQMIGCLNDKYQNTIDDLEHYLHLCPFVLAEWYSRKSTCSSTPTPKLNILGIYTETKL